ncbi:MAG: TSUP family transporter, partial [Patescibacteria group bacterium]
MTSIVIIAYFIKGVLGFGEGLITTSFFLLLFDAKFVLPLALLLVLIGGLYQLAYFKKDISVLVIKTIIIPLIIGVAIGAYLLN